MRKFRLVVAAAAIAATVAIGSLAPRQAAAQNPLPAEAEPRPYLEQVKDGYIDWGAGIVAAWGRIIDTDTPRYGSITSNTKWGAEMEAKARLLAIVQNIRANAEFRIGDRKDVVERVSGIVKGATVIEERSGRARWYEVLVAAPLNGVDGISYAIYELTAGRTQGTPGAAAGGPAPAAPEPPTVVEGEYTGIVIDARGTGLQPALLPRIVDESGSVVSSPETVIEADLQERGMAAYATLPGSVSRWRDRVGDAPIWVRAEMARQQPPAASPNPPPPRAGAFPDRKGPRPYRLKAASSTGALKADIILSKADAERLQSSPEAMKRFKECRVLVIVESPVGGVEGVRRIPPPRPPAPSRPAADPNGWLREI